MKRVLDIVYNVQSYRALKYASYIAKVFSSMFQKHYFAKFFTAKVFYYAQDLLFSYEH